MELNFFQKHKKLILTVIMIGLIAAPLALVPTHFVKADLANPIGDNTDRCALSKSSSWGKCALDAWTYLINAITMNLLGWLVALTGNLLDYFIKFSLDSSFFQNNRAINDGWKLIRDLVNMGFIFILLYIAISTILQSSSYNIRSMLVKLIIAAVLINFSLFVTKVDIDAGNIVAMNFYNALSVPVLVDGKTVNQPNIGKIFQNYLKIQDMYDPRSSEKIDLDSTSSFFNTIMRAITAIIVIYVFLSLAFVFVARIIAFVFVMIFSPIGFIGAVFPGASGAAAKWRKTLIDQTLVAPVFLILIYLVLKIIESNVFGVNENDFSDANAAKTLSAAYYFSYIIIIGLLLMTKKITKNLSGEMGAMVEKFGKKALAVAAGATLAVATGGAAMAARAGIGGLASRAAASEGGIMGKMKDWRVTDQKGLAGVAKRFTGRAVVGGTNKLADASYDARASGLFQKGADKLGLAAGAGMVGLSLKKKDKDVKGYREKEKERTEERTKQEFARAAQLAPSETLKFRAEHPEQTKEAAKAKAKLSEIERLAQEGGKGDARIDGIQSDLAKEKVTLKEEEERTTNAKTRLEKAKAEETEALAKGNTTAVKTAQDNKRAADIEIQQSSEDQKRIKERIDELSGKYNRVNRLIMENVAKGMGTNLSELEGVTEKIKKEAEEKIKHAEGRIEKYATTLEERSAPATLADKIGAQKVAGRTVAGSVGGGLAGIGIGALTGLAAGPVGVLAGATVGAIGGGVLASRVEKNRDRQIAQKIRDNARALQKGEIPKQFQKKKKRGPIDASGLTEDQLEDWFEDISEERKARGIKTPGGEKEKPATEEEKPKT